MNREKRNQQLGMSYVKATRQLQRQLLFYLAQQLGLDVCFQCGKPIETLKEFTVEHKKPWLDVSPDLFWDLSNIAFSHFPCNSGAARQSQIKRDAAKKNNSFRKAKDAPIGQAWCGGHKNYLPVEKFHRNKRNPSGYASYCSECRQNGYTSGIQF